MSDLHAGIARIVEALDLGDPSARKTGRNPRWPYVPVIVRGGRQQQIRRLAYATRGEAVAAAERHIADLRADLAAKLANPRYRALRRQHGLPEEIRSQP